MLCSFLNHHYRSYLLLDEFLAISENRRYESHLMAE
jgi:hypothetical protein